MNMRQPLVTTRIQCQRQQSERTVVTAPRRFHLSCLAMPGMQKDDYISAIQALAEKPPASWTIPELQTGLHALQEEYGIPHGQSKTKTPFKMMALQMNKASKKKSDLQAFARKDLGLNLTGNKTIPVLQRECLRKIYMVTAPNAMDPVGFGLHSALSYEEVYHGPTPGHWLDQEPQLSRLHHQYGLECDFHEHDPAPSRRSLSLEGRTPEEEVREARRTHDHQPAVLRATATVSPGYVATDEYNSPTSCGWALFCLK